METEVISIETPQLFEEAVSVAANRLRAGQVVAVPTETVYGLAANALSAEAVEEIYRVKGRPGHNPVIVHVAGMAMARECVREWPEEAKMLAERFWPGPLTMVLPKSSAIPKVVSAGGETVGIRWPGHPFMQALIKACGFPIAAPSANRANRISPTLARHVLDGLGGRIPLVVDAGASPVGIESTVVELVSGGWRVLRPGAVTVDQIKMVLGGDSLEQEERSAIYRSPGMLPRHYAPKARLRMITWKDEAELTRKTQSFGAPFAKVHVICHEVIPGPAGFGRVAVIPNDPEAYARALYAELHASDEQGAELILVEEVPRGGVWEGIRDRLTRASAES